MFLDAKSNVLAFLIDLQKQCEVHWELVTNCTQIKPTRVSGSRRRNTRQAANEA